jgi:hypothetical protein
MRLPYILRRYETGDLLFPYGGHTWRVIVVDGLCTFTCDEKVDPMPDVSWLRASAMLYIQKREYDNLQIENHRKGLLGLCIIILVVVALVWGGNQIWEAL